MITTFGMCHGLSIPFYSYTRGDGEFVKRFCQTTVSFLTKEISRCNRRFSGKNVIVTISFAVNLTVHLKDALGFFQ